MNESIVKGGVDVGDPEDIFSLGDLGSELDDLFDLLNLSFTWGHCELKSDDNLKKKQNDEIFEVANCTELDGMERN